MPRIFAALLLSTLLAVASCEARGVQRTAADKSAAPQTPFEAPGADGWGRAGSLRYLERTLVSSDPAQPLPLVIMIHGLGDAPRYEWFQEADAIKTPMRVIMPRAPTPYYDGFAWFPFDPASQAPDVLARNIARAADELAQTIAILRARRPTVGRAVVTGFSQGGMLSYALALRDPELVAVSLPIAGLLPEPLWPKQKPPSARYPRIAAMHGDRDNIVPITPTRALHTALSARGYDNSLREFPGVRHQVTPAMGSYLVELLESAVRKVVAGAE